MLAVNPPITYTPQNGGYGLGTTNYVFCKGITDAWCSRGGMMGGPLMPAGVIPLGKPPTTTMQGNVPACERGMFDMLFCVNAKRISDGLSNTIAMGEGATGGKWLLTSYIGPPALNQRYTPAGLSQLGTQYTAFQAWASAESSYKSLALIIPLWASNIMACTLEPLNKTPVTNSEANNLASALNNCAKSSYTNANPASPNAVFSPTTANFPFESFAGQHVSSNFRSDHPGGGNFLFADSSVHFLQDSIDMATYQRLSTIAGNDVTVIPDQ